MRTNSSRSHSAFVGVVCLGLLASSGVARAQSEDGAIAEGLFRDGRALFEQGKYDQACEKFEASERLASAPGTRLNLALCREKQGRTASAWSLFAEVEATFSRRGDDKRAALAHEHVVALGATLKKVVIEVSTPPPGMLVKLDGVALPLGALGTEIPLDPGSHDLTATAPGKKTWQQANLNLGPSATTVHVRIDFEDAAGAPPVEAPAAPLPPPPTPEASVAKEPSHADEIERDVGYGVGAVGIVALGFATYYGVTALTRKNDEQNYPAGSQDRLTVYNQAVGAQTAELVVGGVGVVCLGAGLFLVLSSLKHGAPAATASRVYVVPSVGPGGGGMVLTARF
jgi:hypothetical protein